MACPISWVSTFWMSNRPACDPTDQSQLSPLTSMSASVISPLQKKENVVSARTLGSCDQPDSVQVTTSIPSPPSSGGLVTVPPYSNAMNEQDTSSHVWNAAFTAETADASGNSSLPATSMT